MIIENKENIKKIIMKPSASCFCPLGQDWYRIDFNIEFIPKNYYPDYCDVQIFISNNINKKELTIEKAVDILYNYFQKEYNPENITIQANVNIVQSHFPVIVIK